LNYNNLENQRGGVPALAGTRALDSLLKNFRGVSHVFS